MGLSFHNSIAVIQGYIGKKSPFVRTPKFDIRELGDQIVKKNYFSSAISKTILWEGFFAIYFLLGLVWGIMYQEPTFMAMHFLLSIGYGLIFYFSVKNVFIK